MFLVELCDLISILLFNDAEIYDCNNEGLECFSEKRKDCEMCKKNKTIISVEDL